MGKFIKRYIFSRENLPSILAFFGLMVIIAFISSAPRALNQDFTFQTKGTSSTYTRTDGCSAGLSGNYRYETSNLTVNDAGLYTFNVTTITGGSPYFVVYNGSFNPASPTSNCLGGTSSNLQLSLSAGSYVLVGVNANTTGNVNFVLNVNGPDTDSDGIPDPDDNCPTVSNAGQEDSDGDDVGNVCDDTPNGDTDNDGVDNNDDNCPTVSNADQTDTDSDGVGDACDDTPNGDSDTDGVDNNDDNCPTVSNADQTDTDSDGVGDACDDTPNGDSDTDGVDNNDDNCPTVSNADQTDSDTDGTGDACDDTPNGDTDNDGVDNNDDNCPTVSNADQTDTDEDGIGDACDDTPTGDDDDGESGGEDSDNDDVDNDVDNCPTVSNADQTDTDEDSIGDACDDTPTGDDDDGESGDDDSDNDGVDNDVDNCPTVANAGQEDGDGDGVGDACDVINSSDSDGDGFLDNDDACPNRGDEGYGVQDNGCPPHVVLPPDNRINWQYGDLTTVMYDHADGVVVYCYNGNTWLGMHINQALVDGADTTQAQSVPVLFVDHAGCRTAFYILDSGEYQINIWTFEGKIYEIIADNIDFINPTMRYYDPNE